MAANKKKLHRKLKTIILWITLTFKKLSEKLKYRLYFIGLSELQNHEKEQLHKCYKIDEKVIRAIEQFFFNEADLSSDFQKKNNSTT